MSKIKVPGYTKKEVYNNTIEYRNFSPDLVGFQLTSQATNPLFTLANFATTTSLQTRQVKNLTTNIFSSYISLSDLDSTLLQNNLLFNQKSVYLNLDKRNLTNFALFGSLVEYIRVSLENIIINWPAGFLTDGNLTNINFFSSGSTTINDYTYDSLTDISSFNVNTNVIVNPYNINLLTENLYTTQNYAQQYNILRDMSVSYPSYVIDINDEQYDILEFTGATELFGGILYFKAKGNPFTGLSNTLSYLIRPNDLKLDEFYLKIGEFESYLLNRYSYPKYKATFDYTFKSESGSLIYDTKSVTWPVSDGYNIDFNTTAYSDYASALLDIASNSDLTTTSLMNRFLVSESITSFDTLPYFLDDTLQDDTGQKINKTLNIYGRSYDDVNQYINGISFANTVSYDKLNNTPDAYLKNLAMVLGWDVISSNDEFNIINNYVKTTKSTYSGQTAGLTPSEADVELWRRLILNTPWIWKSKGTRKTIEFLLKFLGIPDGIIQLNEYIYKADGPIDTLLLTEILAANNLSTDLTQYPIDENGYPKPLNNTNSMYYQSNGLWYRTTGGDDTLLDISTGNNPHSGPYDGGGTYINQFRKLIPNITATTITSQTITTKYNELFTNYQNGTVTNYTGPLYVNATYDNYEPISNYYNLVTSAITDPYPDYTKNECGCNTNYNDKALSVCISSATTTNIPCNDVNSKTTSTYGYYVFNKKQYNSDGSLSPNPLITSFIDKQCCTTSNGKSNFVETYDPVSNQINSGYYCCVVTSNKCGCNISCDWVLDDKIFIPLTATTGDYYCKFKTIYGYGSEVVVTSDGSHCPATWTTPIPNITDPYTGLVGYGCKITSAGLTNFSKMQEYFTIKANGGEADTTGVIKKCCDYTYNVYIINHP